LILLHGSADHQSGRQDCGAAARSIPSPVTVRLAVALISIRRRGGASGAIAATGMVDTAAGLGRGRRRLNHKGEGARDPAQ
jgi:hypothetical protein